MLLILLLHIANSTFSDMRYNTSTQSVLSNSRFFLKIIHKDEEIRDVVVCCSKPFSVLLPRNYWVKQDYTLRYPNSEKNYGYFALDRVV